MDLRGAISNLLSLGKKLLPAVVSSAQAPSSSTSPSVEHNHQIQDELEKLMRMLERINATLYDAEQREITDLSVKLWLKELKGVAHRAEDVLGEYHYEVLRAQVEARDAFPPDSQKRKLIQVPSGMLHEIQQIRSRFDEIENDRRALQLSEGDGPRHCNNQIAQTSHLVDESDIFGRESEKEKLIDLLSSECDGVSVVTIVGMGGIGKTTVAQLACNDQRIRQRFDKFGWICVSGDFNVERLTKESLESITGSGCSLTNLSALQEKIRKQMSGKRVLLVLDDVWNENKDLWALFRVPFKSAAVAKILVTTRNDPVAQIMQTETTLNLGYLSAEQCWLLFEHYAFGGVKQNKDPELVEIGKQIMNKCGMLPLAVKSISSLLRHEGEVENWRDILESGLWESDVKREIISPLQISYARLPAFLKSCFLYCSLFPKNYEYDVEELVKLWISQGFIVSKGNKTAEKIGYEYAQQLCQRSLFEIVDSDEGKMVTFKLHDIVHDLARVNSENSCYLIDFGKALIFPNVLYHLYIADFVDLIDTIPSHKFTDLRTLITGSSFDILNDTVDLSMAPKLRALNILGSFYVMEYFKNSELEFLSSIGNLKHLRYLSLKCMSFETLPECICSLYSLQILILRSSHNLKELPTKIGNLISLEEIIIHGCWDVAVLPESLCQLKALRKLDLFNGKLEVLPSDIWSLTNLQTLKVRNTRLSYLPPSRSKFVGIQSLKVQLICETIGWLKDFPDLGGALFLNNLNHISNLMDVQCANLVSMHNLEHLILSWNEDDYYQGKEGCVLKLTIKDLADSGIVDEDLADSGIVDEDLLFFFEKADSSIVVEYQSCFSVMASLQPHPNLRKLRLHGYGGNTFPEWIGSLCKLKYLNISCCNSLQFLKAESLPLALENLAIYGCHQLVSISGMEKLKSLVKFYIDNCWKLCSILGPSLEMSMSAQEGSHGSSSLGLVSKSGMQKLKSLVKFGIHNCGKLCSILGPSLEMSMSAQEGSHGSSSLGLTNLADEWHPVEPCKVEVDNCQGLEQWCLRHGIKCKGLIDSSFHIYFTTKNCHDARIIQTERTIHLEPNKKAKRRIKFWNSGSLLGSGSFGKVYEAISDEGFFFAVKEVLIHEGNHTQQCIAQTELEITLLSQFEHENIVQYYGTHMEETKFYIFLELMTQGSLASLYQQYHLQDTVVSEYTRQILYGLVYLHERNIVHRDIKCAHILVHANGSVKITDFGLAKKITSNNILSCKGSVYWMAPEVVNPKTVCGTEADIWSLGCTVLEMLTRQIPYANIEWHHAFFKIGRGEHPPIPNYLSREAQDFIMQCFRVNPADRPSAVQLLEHPFVKIPQPLHCSPPFSQSSPSQNDDDALISTIETMFPISPKKKVNRRIKSWVKGQLLGHGSFSTVYEAISDEGSFFAVKEGLIDQGTNAQQSITQLEKEISLLSQFEHENILQYYGTDMEETKLYILLELMTQGSIQSLYEKYHLQDTHVSEYTRQILYGLVYLHESNIVHRDIKCANILVHENGSVKIAHFGLAEKITSNNILSCKGSVYWMAPEVVNPIAVSGIESDIWSLGCTVLEMLTRQIPYPNIDWHHAFFKIGRGEQPPIPNHLSIEAQDFIKQCVRVNPAERPSAVQLLEHPFVKIPPVSES